MDILLELPYEPISFFAELFRPPSTPTLPDQEQPELQELVNACAQADELRYTDPIAALEVLGAVHYLSDLAPSLFAGSVGSIFRVLQMAKEARHFLTTALAHANDKFTCASVHRRLAPYELNCNKNCEKARFHALESFRLFESIGAHHDAKRSLVNVLISYYESGEPACEQQTISLAEELLDWPEAPVRTKVAAHQILGSIYFRNGNDEEANNNLVSALNLAPDPLSKGQIYWSIARMAPPKIAISNFDAALHCFGTTYGFEMVLCTIEKVAKLNLTPSEEYERLLSFTHDCHFLTPFIQNLAASARLRKRRDRRELPTNLSARLSRAWSAYRQDQARRVAANLLSHLGKL